MSGSFWPVVVFVLTFLPFIGILVSKKYYFGNDIFYSVITMEFSGNDVNKSTFFFPFTSLSPYITTVSAWFGPINNAGSKISSCWYVSLLRVGRASQFWDPRSISLRNMAWETEWTPGHVSNTSRSQTLNPRSLEQRNVYWWRGRLMSTLLFELNQGFVSTQWGTGGAIKVNVNGLHPLSFLQGKPVTHCLVVFSPLLSSKRKNRYITFGCHPSFH